MKFKYCESRQCPFKKDGKCDPDKCYISNPKDKNVSKMLKMTPLELRAYMIEHCEFIVMGEDVWVTLADDEEYERAEKIRKAEDLPVHTKVKFQPKGEFIDDWDDEE